MKKLLLAPAVVLAMLATAPGSAFAATRVVDEDKQECPNAQFTSIQAAVTASGPGDTVRVCPGEYREQVTIQGPSKNNLTLVSTARRQAVIRAPELLLAEPGDLVTIDGARGVNLLRFTVSGPLPDTAFCSPELRSGVRIKGNGSATLADNRITQIRSTSEALRGCQNGFGVAIGRQFQSQVGQGRLFENDIDMYQKGGIYVDGAGSSLLARDNRVIGSGPSGVIAQNGVQISRDASADYSDGRVVDNTFAGIPGGAGGGDASGFILFDVQRSGSVGRVNIEDTLVQRNDTNIGLFDVDGAAIEENRTLDAVYYDGIFLDGLSSGNRIEENVALRNNEHDCHDDSVGAGTAGTANFWDDNEAGTENRPGLCVDDNEDDDDDDDDDRRSGLTR